MRALIQGILPICKKSRFQDRLEYGATFKSVGVLRKLHEELLDEAHPHLAFMDRPDISISRDAIFSLLQHCIKSKDLAVGRRVQSLMQNSGLSSMPFWGDHLIRLFAACGSLPEANEAFFMVLNPNVYTWNAIISAHVQQCEGERALELYKKMQQCGVKPDKVTFLCSLKACGNIEAIRQGRLIHCHITTNGLESDIVVGSTIIDMYAKCKSLEDACRVFDELPYRNVVSWSSMIAGYTLHGHSLFALELFEKMQQEGVKPSRVTYLCILKTCVSIGAIEQGRLIHNQIIRCGLDIDVVVGNTLVDMYAKYGSLKEAHMVLDKLPARNVVSWTALIGGFAQHGHGVPALRFFEQMQQDGIKPNRVNFLSVLKACGSAGAVEQGRLIHAQILRSDLNIDVVMGSTLVDMYAKCGNLEEAHEVFHKLPGRNVVSWDAIIAGYAQHGQGLSALELFENMQLESVKPIKVTFVSILKACGSVGTVVYGRLIHDQIIRSGLGSDVTIGNTLLDMYAKCGNLKEAHQVFHNMAARNVVSWSAMISGYVQHGHGVPALEYLETMQQEGMIPDASTFSCVLKACGSIGAIEKGRSIHDQIIRGWLESGVIVGSAIVDMYAKCGCVEEAHQVFLKLSDRNVVSWGAMISGYARHGHSVSALEFFDKMQQEGIQSDEATLLSTLKACGSIGAIGIGRVIHGQMLKIGLGPDALVGSTLVDMYANNGCLEEARKVFDDLPNQDVVSWGAMIAGYAQIGDLKMAHHCLQQMKLQGLKPVDVFYTSIISGCSHAGLEMDGHCHFKSMIIEYDIAPNIEQYSCMVDLLGRAGRLSEAEDVLQTMPSSPDITAWTSLLTSCKTYGNIQLGKKCFDEILRLNPYDASGYVLMSNIYAQTQMWENVSNLSELRKTIHAWKKPGMAWIEVDSIVQEFVVGSEILPQSIEIYSKLKRLNKPMARVGYVPKVASVLEKILASDMPPLLNGQYEKLTLGFNFASMYKDAAVQPHFEMYTDCHNAIKVSSNIERQDIIPRNAYQIHCFQDGVMFVGTCN